VQNIGGNHHVERSGQDTLRVERRFEVQAMKLHERERAKLFLGA
jgi:hypothetical protein